MNQILRGPLKKEKGNLNGFEKGQLFEQYIINLFNNEYFYKRIYRKSEELSPGFTPQDHCYPDLEMELFFSGKRKYRFAVECKWQAKFSDGKIFWADDTSICHYRMFQDRVRIPVFVAIGIGGEPYRPDELFLTPLNSIYMHNELSRSNLIPFKRKPNRKFFYDIKQLTLF